MHEVKASITDQNQATYATALATFTFPREIYISIPIRIAIYWFNNFWSVSSLIRILYI